MYTQLYKLYGLILQFFEESIDFDGRDNLSKFDYPPRFTFTVKASKKAKSCAQEFCVTGLNGEPMSFQVQLNPLKTTTRKGWSLQTHTR